MGGGGARPPRFAHSSRSGFGRWVCIALFVCLFFPKANQLQVQHSCSWWRWAAPRLGGGVGVGKGVPDRTGGSPKGLAFLLHQKPLPLGPQVSPPQTSLVQEEDTSYRALKVSPTTTSSSGKPQNSPCKVASTSLMLQTRKPRQSHDLKAAPPISLSLCP